LSYKGFFVKYQYGEFWMLTYLSLRLPTLVYICKGSYSFLTNRRLNVNTYANSEANR